MYNLDFSYYKGSWEQNSGKPHRGSRGLKWDLMEWQEGKGDERRERIAVEFNFNLDVFLQAQAPVFRLPFWINDSLSFCFSSGT